MRGAARAPSGQRGSGFRRPTAYVRGHGRPACRRSIRLARITPLSSQPRLRRRDPSRERPSSGPSSQGTSTSAPRTSPLRSFASASFACSSGNVSTSVRTGTRRGEREELLAVAAREVRDRAERPLAPQEVVRERRDVRHVDARAHDRAALRDRRERGGDELAGRREDDRRVELLRRRARAGPLGAERAGERLRLVVAFAREREDAAALVTARPARRCARPRRSRRGRAARRRPRAAARGSRSARRRAAAPRRGRRSRRGSGSRSARRRPSTRRSRRRGRSR